MFEFQGVWLPDGEKHFPEWMAKNGEMVDGRGTYQIRKLRAALVHVKQWRTAVDVGAHVGLWAGQLVKRFAVVHAFEPVAAMRQCFLRNVPEGAVLHSCALGEASDQPQSVRMIYEPADSGGTHVGLNGADGERAPLRALDEFAFDDVDFLKIDCEGYELEVLKGAIATLLRCRPAIIVEQKPAKLQANYGVKGAPAVDFLRGLGARVMEEISGDYLMAFK